MPTRFAQPLAVKLPLPLIDSATMSACGVRMLTSPEPRITTSHTLATIPSARTSPEPSTVMALSGLHSTVARRRWRVRNEAPGRDPISRLPSTTFVSGSGRMLSSAWSVARSPAPEINSTSSAPWTTTAVNSASVRFCRRVARTEDLRTAAVSGDVVRR